MKNVKGLVCTNEACAREFGVGEVEYTCGSCGANLDIVYDYEKIKETISPKTLAADREPSVLRYFPLLPLSDRSKFPRVQIGCTPIYKADRLGESLGISNLYIKDDGRNPSASYKDRASSVALARALEAGADVICGASTGNAASSLSCLMASMGLAPIIFVPRTAPQAKIAQLLTFGAKVIAVNGSYDNAFDLCLEATAEYGWYNRNTGFNPYTREGKKTCAYEIAESLGWRAPDKVFVSVGDGNIISGIWKGFRDLLALGWIEKAPRMIAVQSEESSAVADALERGGAIEPVSATTIADSISVDRPRDGEMAVRAVLESGGRAVKVPDSEILEAIKTVARGCGVFGEPAGVTAYAGVERLAREGGIEPGETVVAVITGNGLKDVAAAIKVAGEPMRIDPEIGALKELVEEGLI